MTIFGYTWDEIKRAQQGGALARRIPAGIYKPLATDGDWELLERYGEAELRNRNYFGVLDRLENTRMANDMPDCDRSACRDSNTSASRLATLKPPEEKLYGWLNDRLPPRPPAQGQARAVASGG